MLLITSMVSCKKFLEEKQVSSLTQDYYNDENGLNALVNGLYVFARVKHEWDGNGAKLIEPESDAYMHSDPAFARYTSAAYGTNIATIAAQNTNNYIGAANSNFASRLGVPSVGSDFRFIMGGTLKPGASAITNEAAGLGVNTGGEIQLVTEPFSVRNLWFHMP